MIIKITNCTTTTGGGKGTPLRWRQNQNVTIVISDNSDPYKWAKPNRMFIIRGRPYYTTKESKSIIIKN
jgi:hypothetical protein